MKLIRDGLPDVERFYWLTAKGQWLRVDEMQTDHTFNCAKMIYNHIANVLVELKHINFTHKYIRFNELAISQPEEALMTMVFFLREVHNRGDLPESYWSDYCDILRQLLGLGGDIEAAVIKLSTKYHKAEYQLTDKD